MSLHSREFPESFVWGAATSSYQVEGAAAVDGKGPSIWDEFVRRPGAITDDASGEVSCDQYHRFREDVALMRQAGLQAYRFSMAWSRVLPDGRGAINQAGLDYYKRLAECLLDAEIEPYLTWYHWDLPLALERDFGGWRSRETVRYFGEYVARIAAELRPWIKNYFTVNEFLACTDVGYGMGVIAPGVKLPKKELNQVRHHVLLGHGTALAALRAVAPEAKVTIAENSTFMVPVSGGAADIEAAKTAFRHENAHFLTAVMEGEYLDSYLEKEGPDAPEFTDEDMRLIGAPMDYLGLNIYYGKQVRHDETAPLGYRIFEPGQDPKDTGIANLFFVPEAMYWGPRIAWELWRPQEIMVTESGTFLADRMTTEGRVDDPARIVYLRSYLAFAAKAIREGVPLTGYFHWSWLDNFEWHHGYRPRFGLVYVNFQTQERTPKLSFHWYADLIASGNIS